MREILPIAVAMLPINAAVYVFDGIVTGAADFRFMAGACAAGWLGVLSKLAGLEPPLLAPASVWVRTSTAGS